MLLLITGLPNAGKTTLSNKYEEVIHQDDIGSIDKICQKVASTDNAVLEGVFFKTEQRKKIIRAYQGGIKKCIFIDISLDESIKRENRNRHPLILKNAFNHYEPPTLDEGWDEIIIIRGDDNVESISNKRKIRYPRQRHSE